MDEERLIKCSGCDREFKHGEYVSVVNKGKTDGVGDLQFVLVPIQQEGTYYCVDCMSVMTSRLRAKK